MAFGDLATLAQCQAWIVPTPPGSDNALLAQLITSASDFITHYLNRFIPLADYEEIRDGTGGHTMVLANYPVVSVASLTIGLRVIPPAVTEACIELVAVEYIERSRLGVVSENVAGLQSDTWRIMDLLPRTKLALDLFKSVAPVSPHGRRRAPTQTDPATLVGAL